jgi:transcriptional regulator NrdR family protein
MANPIERIKRYTNKIITTHLPQNENSEYDINSSFKAKAIMKCLDELKLDYIADNRYGIIVANSFNQELKANKNNKAIKEKLKEVDLIVVSHIDMISKFNQADVLNDFKENFEKLNDYEDTISGPLDNTITNSTLLALLSLRVNS